jgi:hypothetical protein
MTMIGIRKLLAAAAVGVVLSGCNSGAAGVSGAASGSGAAAAGGSAGSAAGAGGIRTENIADPSLNMTAVTVPVPANWHFQGVLMQGGNCVPTPFPVFRSTSPDGLSMMERQPTMGWRWGTGPLAASGPADCLPLKSALGAQAFLKYLAATMKVNYVSDTPEPAAETQAAQDGLRAAEAVYAPKYAASHLTPPKATRELARALVSYQNGTFAMKGELRVTVDCTETVYPGMKSILKGMADRPDSTVDLCTAATRYYAAPAAQFAQVVALWDAPGMGAKQAPDWGQAWVNRNQQQANQAMAQNIANTNAAMAASAQRFQQNMAVQNQMHQEFMATMQRGTDMSMAQATASMNARSTAASDWVDYALDQQTVTDPNTGQLSKVSSANSYTWVDSTGKTSYQTNDVNANPNGVLQGNWTKQTVVHGNGTQY